ncbi:MAG: EF-hand domain-containing protein, partial [Pirellulales bacterium]|nr:EF-hand domain-containing protein [Pirellulales bacterium]
VPATGAVRYQYFVVDPQFDHDVWMEAAELKPGNREVVHHILAFAVPKGQRRGLDGARGFLVGYVPGARLELAPKGYAKKIPAGSELIFQVHYTPIGTPQQDQSWLGIVLADPESITHEIVTTSAVQTQLRIPPGESNYQTSAYSPRFPAEAKLLSMSPHMHVRGKAYRYELEDASGKRKTLLDIPAYDFNWQTTYALVEPLDVPQGSRFLCSATFDNSVDNLNNPDPTALVKWGDQTWDEMMIGYYHYAVPLGGDSGMLTPRQHAEALIRNAVRLNKFDRLDRDKDGKLARADTPRSLLPEFNKMDKNKDGILTRQEVETAD